MLSLLDVPGGALHCIVCAGGPHPQLLCKLLCTSKAMHAALAQHCRGTVAITVPLQKSKWQPVMTWFGKHGQFVSSLDLSKTSGMSKAMVRKALQRAAAAAVQGQLQLTSFNAYKGINAAILQQLPSSSLTSLAMCVTNWNNDVHNNKELAIYHTMQRLSGLQQLEIAGADCWSFSVLAPLTRLTALKVSGYVDLLPAASVPTAEQLALPVSLQQLELSIHKWHIMTENSTSSSSSSSSGSGSSDDSNSEEEETGTSAAIELLVRQEISEPPVDLGRLTQLTMLTLYIWPVTAQAVLPPQLQVFHVGNCSSAAPLLPLRQLQHLDIQDCRMAANELQQLSRLSCLKEVHLWHYGIGSTTAAFEVLNPALAAAWGVVPNLVQLTVDAAACDIHVPAESLSMLAACTGLTSLQLGGSCGIESVFSIAAGRFTAEKLASVLAQLSNLQRLTLWWIDLQGSPLGVAACMKTIAGLPKLVDLSVGCWNGGPEGGDAAAVAAAAAVGLSAATNLTTLCLRWLGLDDASFITLASNLGQLKQLDLGENPELTDAVVTVIEQKLVQLTDLNMDGCSLTQSGFDRLHGMRSRLKFSADIDGIDYSKYWESEPGGLSLSYRRHAWLSGSDSDSAGVDGGDGV